MNSNRGSVRRFPTEDVGRQIAPAAAYVVLSLVFIKRLMAMAEKMRQTVLSSYIYGLPKARQQGMFCCKKFVRKVIEKKVDE